MKINRFVTLAALALLVVGAMGFFSYRALAQTSQPPLATDCSAQDDDDAEDADTGSDTDDIEEQCGNQSEDEDEAGDVDNGEVENEVEDSADGNEASKNQGVDQDDEVAPAGLNITADEAQAIVEIANPGTTTLNVEFDREGGTSIWEVELENGLEVKVDASSGFIMLTEGRD